VYHVASAALPCLNSSRTDIRDVLMRMSVFDDTDSTKAVLFSLLSLSSLHRNGDNIEATRFKHQALRALQDLSRTNAIHSHFTQIALASKATSFWGLYIGGAKTILSHLYAQNARSLVQSSETALLYQCLHYHDVMSRFSIRHGIGSRILDDVLCLPAGPGNSSYHSGEYADALLRLENRIRHSYFLSRAGLLGACLPPWSSRRITEPEEEPIPLEDLLCRSRIHLFLASTWLYFERTAHSMISDSETLSHILDDAFSLLSYNLRNQHVEWKIRYPPFVLFIIGGEARSDKERKLVLDIMRCAAIETERVHGDGQPCPAIGLRESGLGYATALTKALWTMNDLHNSSKGCLDYSTKLQKAMASCAQLPALL
ncbi:hypothetical protein GQ53DRAFT_631891, partial [Thozetella sp. PMI_491]